MAESWFSQADYQCRLEWGPDGARRAAERGDIVVIVDVLRFTTTVVTAAQHGVSIRPCRDAQEASATAMNHGIERGGCGTRYTLSPLDYLDAPSGLEVALASPNGARCCIAADSAPNMFAGCLLNAMAVASEASQAMSAANSAVTVVACGEQWAFPGEDGSLRFAVEDYLGAGAILLAMNGSKSPEALACESAFAGVGGNLEEVLLRCGSGIELAAKGRTTDVRHAARLDLTTVVPVLAHGAFISFIR